MQRDPVRARSHAHSRLHGRLAVHGLVVLAVLVSTIAFAPDPGSTAGLSAVPAPPLTLSGVASPAGSAGRNVLRPGASLLTQDSVSMYVRATNVESVRVAGAISPISSFSAGVALAAAASGEAGAGVKPLADIIDPTRPFVLYVAQPGDSASSIASRFGIQLGTLLDNNPTVEDKDLIQRGQEIIVPRRDGILYKIGFSDTLSSIVGQYDNITAQQIADYRPNGLQLDSTLKQGEYLLLIGATKKPPPPPPPRPAPQPRPTGTTGGSPPPAGDGRFSFPLSRWRAVSDPFGTNRGGGRIHEGIDLDLYGLWNSPIYSACDGVVSRTEYLTYSYGYYVVIDCGGGWTTLYAHMSRIDVNPGQPVSKGTLLGLSGLTGYTTGEHLHFEIRINGAPVDPANYLGF